MFIEEDIKEGDEKVEAPVGKIAQMVKAMDDGFSDLESADGDHEVEATMKKETGIKTLKVEHQPKAETVKKNDIKVEPKQETKTEA